jgi:hypothetical protein
MRRTLRNLIVNKEYSRKPQMYAGSYQEMQERTAEKYAQDTIGPFPESEHQKPYENQTDDYQELEDLYTPFGFPPYQGPIKVDVPAQAPDRLVCMARTVGTWCKGMTTEIKVMWSEAKGCCAQLLVDPFRFTSGFTFRASCYNVTVTASEEANAGAGIMCLAKLPDGQDGTSFYLQEGTDLTANHCTGDDGQATVISYNQQMSLGTQQTLSLLHTRADMVYEWSITSGGGALSAKQGTSVVYTAPASNPNCVNNPTITVAAKGRAGCRPKDGTVCDTAYIAVNNTGIGPETAGNKGWILRALEGCSCLDAWATRCNIYRHWITCDSTIYNPLKSYEWTTGNCWDSCYRSCTETGKWDELEAAGFDNIYRDTRSAELKAAGCCPYQLM